MKLFNSTPRPGWKPDYDQLAQYNSECARGLQHTPECDARMAEVQRDYDENYVPLMLARSGAQLVD